MFVAVASSYAMPPGSRRVVVVGERRILVVATDDGFYALLDECPHYGVALSGGPIRDGVAECTWHGWRIDVRTGRCLHNPSSVPTFAVEERDGKVYVDIPVDEPSEVAVSLR
jgi:nitrite reductase (NADH) small subunit